MPIINEMKQRKPTNFERTAFELFQKFVEPTTEDQLYKTFDPGIIISLPLVGSTLHEFIQGLVRANYLLPLEQNRFVLSPKGRDELGRLKSLVGSMA